MERTWIKTSEALPTKEMLKDEVGKGVVDDSHAACFIFINGEVKERPYNFHHNCWDDRDFDDFEYEAAEPSHWMLAYPLPEPPKGA